MLFRRNPLLSSSSSSFLKGSSRSVLSTNFKTAAAGSSSSLLALASLQSSALRFQSSNNNNNSGSSSLFDADDDELERELKQQAVELGASTGNLGTSATPFSQRVGASGTSSADPNSQQEQIDIEIKRVERPPARFEIQTTTGVYKWSTTAKYARRVVGPMREWADEFQCRTGVNVQMEAVDQDRATGGGYPSADDVEVNLYLFGSERAIHESVHFLKAMCQSEPSYVRCGVFRRKDGSNSDGENTSSSENNNNENSSSDDSSVEWLTLRRVNPEFRPVDIPPISLKTPGKYTLLFESPEEAIIRTVFEETGVELNRRNLKKTHVFDKAPVPFYWRPRVDYWVCEVPYDTEILGPQSNTQRYVMHWDPRLLRQSADPIDRTWAAVAEPKTGCAWLSSKTIDSLQAPVKLETNYMATRYTPAPGTTYSDLIKFGSGGSDESSA